MEFFFAGTSLGRDWSVLIDFFYFKQKLSSYIAREEFYIFYLDSFKLVYLDFEDVMNDFESHSVVFIYKYFR